VQSFYQQSYVWRCAGVNAKGGGVAGVSKYGGPRDRVETAIVELWKPRSGRFMHSCIEYSYNTLVSWLRNSTSQLLTQIIILFYFLTRLVFTGLRCAGVTTREGAEDIEAFMSDRFAHTYVVRLPRSVGWFCNLLLCTIDLSTALRIILSAILRMEMYKYQRHR
jgi:hypothetical protein